MTLVIIGLLLGLLGIVWVVVLDIVWADRQRQRPGSQKSKRPVAGPMHGSKAA
jgi:hypothetical protein